MSGLDVRIGINPISWSNDDLPSLGGDTPLETALREGRAIGYEGFELGNKFPPTPQGLQAKLAEFDLACVSGWYSGRLAGRGVAQEIEAVGAHLHKLAFNGARVMVYGEVQDAIQGQIDVPLHRRPRFASAADWQAYGARLTAFARYTQDHGVRLAYHHHMGAYCESPEDIARLMDSVGEPVGLLFDTGHATFGGGDPVALMKTYAARVVHVHCKDVRPEVMALARNQQWSFLTSVLNGVFTVPGDGAIDFAGVLGALGQHGYQGWLVVEAEQDPAVAPPYAYATKGYATLRGLVDRINTAGEGRSQ
jgi:inosose dehydratase